MEINLITAIFGGIGTLIGFLITVISFSKNRDKDIKAEASHQATVNSKLDIISTNVEQSRIDFKVEQRERALLQERVTRVEESAKQAHKRIDLLKKEDDK